MNLARFPRRRYADGPTPLQPLRRLSEALGGPYLFIKRDDLLGFAGGNKIRKLEFVVADALQKGADYLITCGAVQSNHCRLTLAAAVREGLKCGLVLEERVPGSYKPQASGNNFLYRLMGVDRITVVPGGSDMPAAMRAMADEMKAQGRRPYVIPGGASSPLGALGYAACAQEIIFQAFDMGLGIDRVVCASGSAGNPRRAPGRISGPQQRHSGRRHERQPAQRAAGGDSFQFGQGDGVFDGHSKPKYRAIQSIVSAIMWDRAIPCRRPAWSKR